MGAAAQAQGEPRHERGGAGRHEDHQDPVERRHELVRDRLELDVMAGLAAVRRRDGRSPVLEARVSGAEDRAEHEHGGGHGLQRGGGPRREGLLADVREAEARERNAREIEHARAARLFLAVDVVHVAVGAAGDALLRLGQHLLPLAEPERVGRTGLDAGRHTDPLEEPAHVRLLKSLPVEGNRRGLPGPVRAVGALLDLRSQRVPLRGRHVPRAGQHAVAAADAFAGVVTDGAVRLRVQSGRRAGRDARRLETVETTPHHEGGLEALLALRVRRLVEGDERVRLRGERGRVLETEMRVQLRRLSLAVVPLLAGDLAGPAADAVGDVDERGLDGASGGRRAHTRLPSARRAPGGAEAFSTLTRQAFVSWVPAPGSEASIVRKLTLGPVDSPWKPQL